MFHYVFWSIKAGLRFIMFYVYESRSAFNNLISILANVSSCVITS